MRLAVMAGESIYANVRLRLTANRTYGLYTWKFLNLKIYIFKTNKWCFSHFFLFRIFWVGCH